jgi:SAM-dependent methyltransferase
MDLSNLLRNNGGNYRFVNYAHRWVGPRLKRENAIISKFIKKQGARYAAPRPWSTLDLGCGPQPVNPFEADFVQGIDIPEDVDKGVLKADLSFDPIPCADCSLDFVTAHDFIEHVPRVIATHSGSRFPFIELMSKVHRVLKPGGFFYSRAPAYPHNEVFQDPTHVNIITSNTFPYYFCWHGLGGPWARIYGSRGRLDLVQQRWSGPRLLTVMRKMPPSH